MNRIEELNKEIIAHNERIEETINTILEAIKKNNEHNNNIKEYLKKQKNLTKNIEAYKLLLRIERLISLNELNNIKINKLIDQEIQREDTKIFETLWTTPTDQELTQQTPPE